MPDEPRDVGCSRWGKLVNTCLQIRTLSCIISQNSCTNQQYNNHIHFLMSYNSSEFKLYGYDIQTIHPTEELAGLSSILCSVVGQVLPPFNLHEALSNFHLCQVSNIKSVQNTLFDKHLLIIYLFMHTFMHFPDHSYVLSTHHKPETILGIKYYISKQTLINVCMQLCVYLNISEKW